MASPNMKNPPLHAGEAAKEKERFFQKCLKKTVPTASHAALALNQSKKLHTEATELAETTSGTYNGEEMESDRVYPPFYQARPIEAQVATLKNFFPALGDCEEKLAHKLLPDGAEAWFAIPRWQALAPTYNEAVERILEVLASERKMQNLLADRLGPNYLRQSKRAQQAMAILADQQPGNDILVVAAQAGMRHRGCSARRALARMTAHEFGAGVFASACLLLTHPERLSSDDTLMIACGGDEYSARGDCAFDRVPLFDYGLSGIEFSIFYKDRARMPWGTPSGFLRKTL